MLKQLSAGVYAWIGANGDSNAGGIMTRRGLVAIDAQQSPRQGRDFRIALERASGHPVSSLINTHFHLDHTAGNIAFCDVDILSQEKTPALMNAYMGTQGVRRWRVDSLDERLRLFFGSNFNNLVSSDDPLYAWFVSRVQRPGLEILELVAPNKTLDDMFIYERDEGEVHLDYVGPAHCDGEILVHLPREKIAFLGDLLFVGRFPWLGDCFLPEWIECLGRIASLDLTQVVPGHGDVCTLREVDAFRTLLVSLRDAVKAEIAKGSSEEAAMNVISLPEYQGLPRYCEWMLSNIRSIYRQIKQG